jgi:hypothetical protein
MDTVARRLSQIRTQGDAGLFNLPWDLPKPAEMLMRIDLTKLNTTQDVQSIPPQILYHSLKCSDQEDWGRILALTSADQFQRLVDYESWRDEQLDRSSLALYIQSLDSAEDVFIKFKELDEEMQIATLQGFTRSYDKDSFENLNPEHQDRLFVLPCGEAFYEILTEDANITNMIKKIIDSALAVNIAYGYSLLAHADYMPPQESEAMALQFRSARLSEDGFLPYEESVLVFYPYKTQELEKITTPYKNTTPFRSGATANESTSLIGKKPEVSNDMFFDRVIIASDFDIDQCLKLQMDILTLANAVCSATHIEAHDISAINALLVPLKSIISLGLEITSHQSLDTASRVLNELSMIQIFRVGLTHLYTTQKSFVEEKFEETHPTSFKKLLELVTLGKWALVHDWIDGLDGPFDLQDKEVIKAFLNRFPMKPLESTDKRIRFKHICTLRDLDFLENAHARRTR